MAQEQEVIPKGFDPASSEYLEHLQALANGDVAGLKKAEKSYGNSWKKRGGVGAFMMLARKWDRLEQQVKRDDCYGDAEGAPAAGQYNIFHHIEADTRAEGIIDDIRDLRRYLLLVEAEMVAQGVVLGKQRDNVDPVVSHTTLFLGGSAKSMPWSAALERFWCAIGVGENPEIFLGRDVQVCEEGSPFHGCKGRVVGVDHGSIGEPLVPLHLKLSVRLTDNLPENVQPSVIAVAKENVLVKPV